MKLYKLNVLALTFVALALAANAYATQLTDATVGTYPGPSSATYDGSTGVYTISIDGTGAETSNYRNFDYTSVAGDFSVTVNITGLPTATSSQLFQAGLMARNTIPGTTAANTYESTVDFYPLQGLCPQATTHARCG